MEQLSEKFLVAIGWSPPDSPRTKNWIKEKAGEWNLSPKDFKGYWLNPTAERLCTPPDYLHPKWEVELLKLIAELYPGVEWHLQQAEGWSIRCGSLVTKSCDTPAEALMRFVIEWKKKGHEVQVVR